MYDISPLVGTLNWIAVALAAIFIALIWELGRIARAIKDATKELYWIRHALDKIVDNTAPKDYDTDHYPLA
jgi:hypothetical protein